VCAQAKFESQEVKEMLDAFDDLGQRVPIGPMFFYSHNSGLQDAEGKASGLVDKKRSLVPAASALSARAEQN